MLQKSVRFFVFSLFFTIFGCETNETMDGVENTEGVIQQGLYSGPPLKLPLPGGFAWKVNTNPGYYSPDVLFHSGIYFHAIDFGDNVDVGGFHYDMESNTIDVLAAANGYVSFVENNCAVGATNNACKVFINHSGTSKHGIDAGYETEYTHLSTGITLSVGQYVDRGQVIGKMGSTGTNATHLHFSIRYNMDSSQSNSALSGMMLEMTPFANYAINQRYQSTNNFTYTFLQPYGANPRTCSNFLTGNPASCTQQSRFNLNRYVFSDVLVESTQQDVCIKAEIWMGSNSVQNGPDYCTTNIQPGGGLYFNIVNYSTTTSGTGEIRYFARAKNSQSYLSAPFAVTQFVVLDSNTPTNQPAPTITSPGNWTIVPAPSANLSWSDAPPWQTQDHDLYFWYWNGSTWVGLGWLYGLTGQNALIGTPNGLPAYQWLAWEVRSCGSNGCSAFSAPGYFALSP